MLVRCFQRYFPALALLTAVGCAGTAPPGGICGNGITEAAELCDDGNDVDGDSCRNDCEPARCGDAVLRAGEEDCDDGNDVDEDGCRNDCSLATCGDGVLWSETESCDDGNSINTDACTNACEPARCGDGIVRQDLTEAEAGFEFCDDGNDADDDACRSTCVVAVCGDGVARADRSAGEDGYEDCDDGNDLENDACLSNCLAATCGDGILREDVGPAVSGYEACDDGDDDDSNGCTNACLFAVCNDGILRTDLSEGQEGYEYCDDGNLDEYDACLNDCVEASCGDEVTRADLGPGAEGYEACDDGNDIDADACLNNCAMARCGDGVLRLDLFNEGTEGYEFCDDGNDSDADDCVSGCVEARCGDGILRTEGERDPEACDDGDRQDRNGCRNNCQLAVCGDGILRGFLEPGDEGFEACDDGNVASGDDCSANCRFELVQITAGYAHSCALRADGRTYCWGANDSGQLGDGTHLDRSRPVRVRDPRIADDPDQYVFSALAAGNSSTCGLISDSGRVFCWGSNDWGQLGLGDLQDRSEPQVLANLSGVSQLVGGGQHHCAVADGSIFCWGRNDLGQLGFEAGARVEQASGPVRNNRGEALSGVVNLKANNHGGCSQSAFGGGLGCWGANGDNQLGNQAYPFFDYALDIEYEIETYAVGGYHICHAEDDRRVSCMGRNDYGQVHPEREHEIRARRVPGVPRVGERIEDLHAGGYFSCVETDRSTLRCWGRNDHGQLGRGGAVEDFGRPGDAVMGFDSIHQVALGFSHGCVLDGERALRCWGRNNRQQLGIGNDPGDHLTNPAQGLVTFDD